MYDSLKGSGVISFARNEIGGRGLDNRVWRILMRDSNEVPAEFAYNKAQTLDAVQRTIKGVKAKRLTNPMEVYLDDSEKSAKLRAWYVGGLESSSFAGGRGDLGRGYGRFVGKAPEAPSAPTEVTPELSQTVKPYTTADLQAFDEAMRGLEAVVRPDVLESFVNLRKKL